MESGSTAEAYPASARGDTIHRDIGVLDIGDEDFENVLDERFMTVNRINDKYEGEVILSGNHDIDELRILRVIEVGRARGVHVYARKHGGDSILIFFTADTACRE